MKIIIYLRASSKTNFISSLLEHTQHLFETKVHIIKIKFASIIYFIKPTQKLLKTCKIFFKLVFF